MNTVLPVFHLNRYEQHKSRRLIQHDIRNWQSEHFIAGSISEVNTTFGIIAGNSDISALYFNVLPFFDNTLLVRAVHVCNAVDFDRIGLNSQKFDRSLRNSLPEFGSLIHSHIYRIYFRIPLFVVERSFNNRAHVNHAGVYIVSCKQQLHGFGLEPANEVARPE